MGTAGGGGKREVIWEMSDKWQQLAKGTNMRATVISLCLLVLAAQPSYAATKGEIPLVRKLDLAATLPLVCSWDLGACAVCSHGAGAADPDNPAQPPGTAPGFGVNIGNFNWALNLGTLVEPKKNVGFLAEHKTRGSASAVFSATSLYSAVNKNYNLKAEVAGTTTCYATAALPPCTAESCADIKSMSIATGIHSATLSDWHGTAKAESKSKKSGNDGTVYAIGKFSSYNVADPVTLSLVEEETGQVWSEELFSVDIDAQDRGGVTFTFDNEVGGEGVLLSCNPDENIQMDGHSDGSWLVSPYGAFSASLSEGHFAATGVWASMPWQLVYEDLLDPSSDVLSAFLPSEYVSPSSDMSYQLPEDLYHDGNTYDILWESSGGVHNEASDSVVPEPATLSMLAIAGLALLRRRK